MKLISLNIGYYPTSDQTLTNLIEQIIAEKNARGHSPMVILPVVVRNGFVPPSIGE